MGILRGIKRFFVTRENAFEISGDTGLLNSYAIRKARGQGGKGDPELAEILERNARRLEEKSKKARQAREETKGKVVRVRTG